MAKALELAKLFDVNGILCTGLGLYPKPESNIHVWIHIKDYVIDITRDRLHLVKYRHK